MTVELLTQHRLEFLSLKGDCTGLSESTLIKMTHCWKSHVMAHMVFGADPTGIGVTVCLPYLKNQSAEFFQICVHITLDVFVLVTLT